MAGKAWLNDNYLPVEPGPSRFERDVARRAVKREGLARRAAIRALRNPDRNAIAFDESELKNLARHHALYCQAMLKTGDPIAWAAKQVTLPSGPTVTRGGLKRRILSEQFWLRALRKKLTRDAEHDLRAQGEVKKNTAPYLTEQNFARIKAQRRANRALIKRSDLVDVATGEICPLATAVDGSVSDPAIRRGELMTRVRGTEEYAKANGHAGLFITLTCPSAFHAYLSTGELNPRWNLSTVHEARDWLQHHWAKFRARCKKGGIDFYGYRFAEPHHDGTPHWHLVCFAGPSHLMALRAMLRALWLFEYADEPGAADHRTNFKTLDPAQGSAAAYCAAYVAKNIDGFRLEDDHESGLAGSDGAARAVAWAALHGIRQFQQLGGARVTMYRELRRVEDSISVEPIEAARLAADEGDWRAFMDTVRAAIAAGLDYEKPAQDKGSGLPVPVNQWGELVAAKIMGLKFLGQFGRTQRIVTHKIWKLMRRLSKVFSDLGPVSITVRDGRDLNNPLSWANPRETGTYGPL